MGLTMIYAMKIHSPRELGPAAPHDDILTRALYPHMGHPFSWLTQDLPKHVAVPAILYFFTYQKGSRDSCSGMPSQRKRLGHPWARVLSVNLIDLAGMGRNSHDRDPTRPILRSPMGQRVTPLTLNLVAHLIIYTF